MEEGVLKNDVIDELDVSVNGWSVDVEVRGDKNLATKAAAIQDDLQEMRYYFEDCIEAFSAYLRDQYDDEFDVIVLSVDNEPETLKGE